MQSIIVEGRRFKLFLTEEEILGRIAALGKAISESYEDQNPVFLCVLNGSFYFAAELVKHIPYAYELSFVRLKSYDGLHSAKQVKEFVGLEHDFANRHVVVVEDIVESGLTTHYLLNQLKAHNPASVRIATLLYKPNRLKHPTLPADFIGFTISDEFVIGFGLDLNQKARNLRAIYQLVEE